MAAKVMRSFRLPVGVDERLDEVAAEQGLKKTDVVVAALSAHFAAGGPPTAPGSFAGPRRVDLARVAAEQTGLPIAVCRAKIRGRKLTVAGEVWIDDLCESSKLDGAPVVFDGAELLVAAGTGTVEGP